MSVSNSQLADEFEEIKRRFSASPYIQITATSGNPPESYEVTYHVKGISQVSDGQAVIVDSHRVSIVLPFGYPHFPPNCKPLTTIFHPDFDPDAVCIGDFWNSSHSLAELIVHIGRLISYQTFSQEDVFNREALEWAKDNGDQLPLDQADFSARTAPPPDMAEESAGEPATAAAQEEAPPAGKQGKEPAVKAGKAVSRGKGGKKGLLAVVCGVLLLAAGIGGLVVLDQRNLKEAEQKWAQVAPLVAQSKFTEANKQVKAAQELLGKVYFLKSGEKQAIEQQIKELTDSRRFQEGLQGKVKVDGRYITVQQQQDINAVNGLLAKAGQLADAGKWQEAATAYDQAEKKTADLDDLAPLSLAKVRELAAKSRLQWRLDEGNRFMAQGKWAKAQDSYQQAMEILVGMPQDAAWESTRSEIQTRINAVAFSAAVERGDQFSADRQWSQAADSYAKALQMVDNHDEALVGETAKIKAKLDRARFNLFYETGQQDFNEGKWDAAIDSLEKSEALLAAAKAAGGALEISRTGIKRKIVSATVKRGEAAVTALLEEEKYSQVVRELQTMISTIDSNRLGNDKEFAPVRKSAEDRIGRYRFLADIQQKIAYLLSRYEVIFKDFFPSSARSKLSDPQITFVRQEGSLLIFKMRCVEENRRQKFALEMNYQYDSKSGQWSARPVADVAGPAGK